MALLGDHTGRAEELYKRTATAPKRLNDAAPTTEFRLKATCILRSAGGRLELAKVWVEQTAHYWPWPHPQRSASEPPPDLTEQLISDGLVGTP